MISLISGKYKGRKLYQIGSVNVRPTQAKIRKSIFQILEPFNGCDVLDLYAGSGSLGFEALSRGASKVVFVEKNKSVVKILNRNKTLFKNENIEINQLDVFNYYLINNHIMFDIIFADPPYDYKYINELLQMTLSHLKPKGIFCLEMKKQIIDHNYDRIKYYGNTQVVLWENKV